MHPTTNLLVLNQDPGKELRRAHWQHTVPTVVGVPLCTVPGLQEGGQADSWRGRDLKKMIKENSEEIWWKEKERQNQQSSGRAVPAGQASCVHHFKTSVAEQMATY